MLPNRLLSAEEVPLWRELWDYLINTYFSVDTQPYENLGFGNGTMATVRNLLIGLLLGVIFASFAIILDKRHLGNFVRRLLREECVGRDNAKTLYELDSVTKFSIRQAVRRSVNLRRVVKCREEEEFLADLEKTRAEYEEKRREDPSLPRFRESTYRVDPDTDHFYIPEELAYTAERKFDKKGSGWLIFFLIVLISIFLFAFLLFVIPEILQLLDELVGSMQGGNGKILTRG